MELATLISRTALPAPGGIMHPLNVLQNAVQYAARKTAPPFNAIQGTSVHRRRTAMERSEPWHLVKLVGGRFGEVGGVAQLGERSVRNAEVEGSTPFASTDLRRFLYPQLPVCG